MTVAEGAGGRGPSRVSISLEGGGDCAVRHAPSGARLRTSKPPEYGGSGASFSSTDLLAIALGTCIATDLEPVAVRHGVELSAIGIEVEKALSLRPKRIESLDVRIELPSDVSDEVRVRLERAADHCLVRRSLATDVRVSVTMRPAPAGGEA